MLHDTKENNREDERRKINEMAWIVDPDVGHPMECTLREISVSGVLVELAHAYDLPNYLLIILSGEDQAIECEVAWRSGKNLGVKFV